ncbi:unnamed protein product [Brachionus calyciflorus]|uniref:SOCS box domain-containing protein n=1 Tax=Brachionus calyciflorus TaxID=104777 RepID=A0A813S3R1_9BILA|nr:unnamed protein product [Brachionus calyciflorus]
MQTVTIESNLNPNQFTIINRGKLPNSSYFDICKKSQTQEDETLNDQRAELSQEQQQQEQNTQQTSNISVWSCVFSPDYSHLAWSCGQGLVKVMKCKTQDSTHENFGTPRPRRTTNDSSPNQSLSSSPSTSTNEITSKFFSKKSEIFEIQCADQVWSVAFGSSKSFNKHCTDSKRPQVYRRFNFDEINLLLAIGLSTGRIRIYDGTTGQFLFALYDHSDLIRDLKFSKDGSLQLASVSKDTTIKLWNMYDDGNMYKTLKGHMGMVYSCDWSPTAPLLCSVGSNRQAFIWDMTNYNLLFKLKEHLHDVVTCEFSPDGVLLATGCYDTTICLWDPYNGQLIRKLFHLMPPPSFIYAGGSNGAYVRSLRFSVNGDHLVSISDDKKIRIWSLCSKSALPVCEAQHKDAICLAYASNSRSIMVGTRSGQVDFYEVKPVIPKLMNLCRKAVNQFTKYSFINQLCLPNELKKYLKYEDLKDQTSPKSNINSFNSSKINQTSNSNQYKATIAF